MPTLLKAFKLKVFKAFSPPTLKWKSSVFSMSARKVLTYRSDFWGLFFLGVIIEILVAYFLWKSIFAFTGKETMGGHTFPELITYYVFAACLYEAVSGHGLGFIFREIYEGALNKYLLYPIPFFSYKYLENLAKSCFSLLQLFLALITFHFFFGIPESILISPASLVMGLISVIFASYLYFCMASILECISFWADNVWSLLVLLRFVIYFLSGFYLPLSFFPEWSQPTLNHLPFNFMLSFPIRTFMGKVSLSEFLMGLGEALLWIVLLRFLLELTWRKGLKQYSGVGI